MVCVAVARFLGTDISRVTCEKSHGAIGMRMISKTWTLVWLVADGWCWFILREKYCWLVAGGWFVVREKYCWLVADKPSEQAALVRTPLARNPHAHHTEIPTPNHLWNLENLENR
jgi:hypothetical protein